MNKWEKYVTEHTVYREKYSEFTVWLANSKSKIDDIAELSTDKDTLQQGRESLQVLLGDKEEGIQRLNACIQYGEKLYPDTATSGREKIRQQLRTAKDVWDSLLSDMAEMQRRFDNTLDLWSTYNTGAEELEKWILEVETWLKADTEMKNTLQEKKGQLQNNKVRHIRPFLVNNIFIFKFFIQDAKLLKFKCFCLLSGVDAGCELSWASC